MAGMKTQILYEDRDMLVCFKPPGLAVQSGRAAEPDVVSELRNYLAKGGQRVVSVTGAGGSVRCGLPSEKKPVYLGVIHRLDQPVSGILVFAKNQRAAASLSRQAADHLMQKTYRAIVLAADGAGMGAADARAEMLRSIPGGADGTGGGAERENAAKAGAHELTDYMIKEPGGGARIAGPKEKGAKKAQLFYRCLERKENRALLEIDLKTGRHHQIRVQMAHAGMPLLGDARYGSEESRELSRRLGIRSVQLQAVKLAFAHPATGKKVVFELEKKLEQQFR